MYSGASVWDGEMCEKVVNVEGSDIVWAVDISPDSTRFATGTGRKDASIWSISTGERVVGPLKHDMEIRFSPTGERVATACVGSSVPLFDTSNKLITLKPRWRGTLAWSSDGQQIFVASNDNKIKSFDVSTGSQLAELQILRDILEVSLHSFPHRKTGLSRSHRLTCRRTRLLPNSIITRSVITTFCSCFPY